MQSGLTEKVLEDITFMLRHSVFYRTLNISSKSCFKDLFPKAIFQLKALTELQLNVYDTDKCLKAIFINFDYKKARFDSDIWVDDLFKKP